MTLLLSIIGVLALLSAIAVAFFKKVPHGWVQFKTGLVLRFLPPLDSASVVTLRNGLEKFVSKKIPGIAKALPVARDSTIDIPTRHDPIMARVLVPEQQTSDKVCILMHGGGWCIGSTKTYEEVSRRLARETGSTVVSLEYSLSPESKFPKAHEECLDATTWIANNLHSIQPNAKSIFLVGDSAGGNLVVSTVYESALEVRQQISHLIAVYPVVDSQKKYYSNEAYAKGYYLTGRAMEQFTEAMLTSESQVADRRLSPIQLDMVEAYPKTMVLTADFDPLRDQGEAYANKIKKEGADVILKRYHGTIHAFFGLKDFGSRGVQAITDIGSFLRDEAVSDLMSLS